MGRVLLAGATGYLGSYILRELLSKGYKTRVLVRKEEKLPPSVRQSERMEVVKGSVTDLDSIKGCCRNVETVISTVGITDQKEGFTYQDVDHRGNLHLLEEAEREGVRKFVYASVLNGERLTHLKICEAKEAFVQALKKADLNHCVIRPNGYFSDMGEFYRMAKKGRIYLFGNGQQRMNPIHGADLAELCVGAIKSDEKEIRVGGPQILTQQQIAETAFSVLGKQASITRIPDWIRRTLLFLLRTFTSSKTYGPIEFFMTVLSMDMVAPEYGERTLEAYFQELRDYESPRRV